MPSPLDSAALALSLPQRAPPTRPATTPSHLVLVFFILCVWIVHVC